MPETFNFTKRRISSIICQTHNYLETYKSIIALTESSLRDEDLYVVLANAIYGWMPTILKSMGPKASIDDVRKISGGQAALKFIEALQIPLLNNSWVGTSKFLHFINPETFPIWDSRVAKRLNVYSDHKIKQKRYYLEYLSYMHSVAENHSGQFLAEAIEEKYGYFPTNMRCLELYLFVPMSRTELDEDEI